RILVIPVLSGIKMRYGFATLEPEVRNGKWWIQGIVNPSGGKDTGKEADTAAASSAPSEKDTGCEHVNRTIFQTEEEMIAHAGENNGGFLRGSETPSWSPTGVPYMGERAQQEAYLETKRSRILVEMWFCDQGGNTKCYSWRRVALPPRGREDYATHRGSRTELEEANRDKKRRKGEQREIDRKNREEEDD
ncbi:hypothetical protein MUO98_01470, partial [Candidatus Bathyarchaeota archaeon]|nr:hypothetical protein [Candidatus Bathyarchaeota archaeon]